MSQPSNRFEPGDRLGDKYELLSPLGEGGFGAVYRARQETTGQIVAIKVLHESSGEPGHDLMVARFEREMQLIAQLKHPHIVGLIDSGVLDDGAPFLVLEFVDGEPLSSEIFQRTIPPSRALRLMKQSLEALAYAHKEGVIHRDFKPHNVMVTDPGPRSNAVVLDFGISALMPRARDEDYRSLTGAGHIPGTPAYMAPEQLFESPPSPQNDLYAWGLVFLECLTGEPAISEQSLMQLLMQQASTDPIEIPPQLLATRLGQIIQRAVEKKPEQRYQSANEILDDLEGLTPDDLVGLSPPLPDGLAETEGVSRDDLAALSDGLAATEGVARDDLTAFSETLAAPGIPNTAVLKHAQAEPPATAQSLPTTAQAEPPATAQSLPTTAQSLPTTAQSLPTTAQSPSTTAQSPSTVEEVPLRSGPPTWFFAALAFAALVGIIALMTREQRPQQAPSTPDAHEQVAKDEGTHPPESAKKTTTADPVESEKKLAATDPVDPPAKKTTTADSVDASATIEATPPAPAPPSEIPEGMVWVPPGDVWLGLPPGKGEVIVEVCKKNWPNSPTHCTADNLFRDTGYHHSVPLPSFFIDETEVTVAAYRRCVEAGQCTPPSPDRSRCAETQLTWALPDNDRLPVNCIDWHQAYAYCHWADKKLPTEAQWMRAAKGDSHEFYPWGDAFPFCHQAVTRNVGCDRGIPVEVGTTPPDRSFAGALDVVGNLAEWTASVKTTYPIKDPSSRSAADAATKRLVAGSSFGSKSEGTPLFRRAAYTTSYRYAGVGVRCMK